jgi:hypothetical protein
VEAGPWVETCWLVDGLYVKCSGLDCTYVVGGPRACRGAAKVGMSSGRIVARLRIGLLDVVSTGHNDNGQYPLSTLLQHDLYIYFRYTALNARIGAMTR